MSYAENTKYWYRIETVVKRNERQFFKKLVKLYKGMSEEVILNLKRLEYKTLFDIPKWQDLFAQEVSTEVGEQAVASIIRTGKEMNIDLAISSFDEQVFDMIGEQVSLVKDSVLNSHEFLREKISKTLKENSELNTRELQAKLVSETEEYFNGTYNQAKANQIAQNTSNYVENKVQHEVAVKKNLKKVWVTKRDGRVRRSHEKLDGEVIMPNGAFNLGENGAKFPKDTGDPSEDINCRCRIRLSR